MEGGRGGADTVVAVLVAVGWLDAPLFLYHAIGCSTASVCMCIC